LHDWWPRGRFTEGIPASGISLHEGRTAVSSCNRASAGSRTRQPIVIVDRVGERSLFRGDRDVNDAVRVVDGGRRTCRSSGANSTPDQQAVWRLLRNAASCGRKVGTRGSRGPAHRRRRGSVMSGIPWNSKERPQRSGGRLGYARRLPCEGGLGRGGGSLRRRQYVVSGRLSDSRRECAAPPL
jgi:hypothetical protein